MNKIDEIKQAYERADEAGLWIGDVYANSQVDEWLHYLIGEVERLRMNAVTEYAPHDIEQMDTTTEPTGARREICPDHSDEKPQISSSHTWTQDGNTYFVSYVEYCPTCYHVISTSARL